MRTWNKYLLTLFFLSFLTPIMAQESESEESRPAMGKQWYAGLEGSIPFGVSTFSSFEADKTHVGFAAGLYGGYRFNPAVSLELSMKWGEVNLSAKQCCVDAGYWLGSDGIRYVAPVLGMNGWNYTDIKSRVFMQRYGLRLPVNVLGLFPATKQSRWSLELVPELSLVGTKATISSIATDDNIAKKDNSWHLGVGGNVQATYRITDHLSAGVFSGITHLTGNRMDGMPEHQHNANYLWESGIRLGWTFGSCKKKQAKAIPSQQPTIAPKAETEVCEEPAMKKEMEPKEENRAETIVSDTQAKEEPTTKEEVQQPLPTVYFAFNSTRIASSEVPKLRQMLATMQEDANVSIHIDGWCDTKGSKAVNKRISAQRAQAVKAWLVRHGIDSERITTKGCGSDYNQPDAAKARRADTNGQPSKGKENQE